MNYTAELETERNILGKEFFLIHYSELKQERLDIGHIAFIKKYKVKSETVYKIYGSYKKNTPRILLLQKIKNGYNLKKEVIERGMIEVGKDNNVSKQTVFNILYDKQYTYLYKK